MAEPGMAFSPRLVKAVEFGLFTIAKKLLATEEAGGKPSPTLNLTLYCGALRCAAVTVTPNILFESMSRAPDIAAVTSTGFGGLFEVTAKDRSATTTSPGAVVGIKTVGSGAGFGIFVIEKFVR